jgi:hypothetical protein
MPAPPWRSRVTQRLARAGLRQEMETELAALDAAPEPRNLRRIKNEVARRWTAVPLIDVLKEAVLRTGCLQAVTAVTGTGHLAPEVLAERLNGEVRLDMQSRLPIGGAG